MWLLQKIFGSKNYFYMCVAFCVLTAHLFGFYFGLLLVVIKEGLLNFNKECGLGVSRQWVDIFKVGDTSRDTVFHRKMSHILDLFKVEDKIMNIMDNFFLMSYFHWIRYHFFVQCSWRKVLSNFYLREGVLWSDKAKTTKWTIIN